MKKLYFLVLAVCSCWAFGSKAQLQGYEVDRSKYPDYSESVNPDYSLMHYQGVKRANGLNRAAVQRPDHVNNAATKFFSPVFNQDGGSCGSASRICYMFSYELAAYRDLDGSKAENYYPSHFVWLHTNSPGGITDQGKDAFVTKVGVPSAATYGGQTYSSLFGYQEASDDDFGWMQGYDKWYEAMHNRMLKPSNFPVNVGTEEGREAVKNWLWNHNGDESFHAGGICGIGVASGGDWQNIPTTENNAKIGVAGLKYVKKWGTAVDHALTIVGYDDRVEFDLDGDGVYGEVDADELGAWIIVNSWGSGWCNGGFIYCPYAHGVPAFNQDGTVPTNFWTPEIYRVRKDYRPLRTIKLKMDYSHRSEIALSAGLSTDLNASEPEQIVSFVHFTYAGDGNYGNSNPAPEVPMLGRWADGKLHTEPMEFGYDLTDLTGELDYNKPLKYFFIIDTKDWAQGRGTIYNASIMDYRYDERGVEIPFVVGDGVEIKNAGGKTIISVVVYGSSYYAPQNVAFQNNVLKWAAPLPSSNQVASYNVYAAGELLANVEGCQYALDANKLLPEYSVSAVYADGNESAAMMVKVPLGLSNPNVAVDLKISGFTIPKIFGSKYKQATIEYWIKPHSLIDWNQSAGQWDKGFMIHANGDGGLTAGWNTSNRVNGTSTKLVRDSWNHVAIVVDNNIMTVYINGVANGSVTSNTFSGIGGFGDLDFSSNGASNAQDAVYDEIRIWNTARTADEIANYKNIELTSVLNAKSLLAYYKGDLIEQGGVIYLRDCVNGNHAQLHNDDYEQVTAGLSLSAPSMVPAVVINDLDETIYTGLPVSFTADYNEAVEELLWTVSGVGLEALAVQSPTVVFTASGSYTVTVQAKNAVGEFATASKIITVQSAPRIDATFAIPKTRIPAGERVTFLANNPVLGYTYAWEMPGADNETSTSVNAAATYQKAGTYDVTLTVVAADGTQESYTQAISVVEVAPEVDFTVSPAVIVKGDKVQLTDKSLYAPTDWKWILDNGIHRYVVNAQHAAVVVDQPGVYSVNLDAANATGQNTQMRERALIVCNADSKNGLTFNYDAAKVSSQSPFSGSQNAFTIDWWMNAGWPSTFCNGIGDTEQILLLKTTAQGEMRLYAGGDYVATSADYVIPGEWHHYAVTFDEGEVKFYRDGGLLATQTIARTAIDELSAFCVGGEQAPFSGSIDELRVWRKALSQEALKAYANAPIVEVQQVQNSEQLALYYDFNQSGGDVQDLTSNGNNGVRTGFGPDGDAWGLSKGVFCLNFEEAEVVDVTAQYLTNYAKPFSYDGGQCVNSNLSNRTFALTGWNLANSVVDGSIITGAHVDKDKNTCMTFTTEWDSFSSMLADHKVYQTVTLPAGSYTFSVNYDDVYEGQCGNSYVVASWGESLPNTADLSECIAYTTMKPKGQAGNNAVTFLLSRETTVSLGLLVNMSGKLCMTLQRFTLLRGEVTELTPSGEVHEDKAEMKSLLSDLKTLMESCGDYYLDEAKLTADRDGDGFYLWSNAPQSGSSVASLLDNAAPTFFHSNWQSEVAPADGLDHHLTIELGDETISSFKFGYQARTGDNLGDYPTTIVVQGSTDGINYSDIETVQPRNANGGNVTNGEAWLSDVIGNGNAYNYLRFMVKATTTNKKKDGHIFWHMAEFDLYPRSASPQLNAEYTFVPAAFVVAEQAAKDGDKALERVLTPDEYAEMLAELQTAYDDLATALASGKLPVLLSLDEDKPHVYKVGINRDFYAPAAAVLQYDLASTAMVDVVSKDDDNLLQAWYFTPGGEDGRVYIHPYVGGGDVLSAKTISDGHSKVVAAAKGAEGFMQEWIIVATDGATGYYNIKPFGGNTYFSNHSGRGCKMGFYWDKNDSGSKFTFDKINVEGEIWHHTLSAYLAERCAKEQVADGNTPGYYQGGAAYNEGRAEAAAILSNDESTSTDCQNAYWELRSANDALVFLVPKVGKFYRLKSKVSGNYMNVASESGSVSMVGENTADAASRIFYLTENNKLLSYKLGTYLNSDHSASAKGESSGTTLTFNPSESNDGGYFTLKTNDNTLYLVDVGEEVGQSDNYVENSCEWMLEEVEVLPVSVNASAGFASFYSPVSLMLPEGLTAYVVSEVKDDKAVLTEIAQAGQVVYANTAILLEGDGGEYDLTITAEASADAVDFTNMLRGTIDDQIIEYGNATHYMLSVLDGQGALYRVARNLTADGVQVDEQEATHFKNNGFKSYLTVLGANVKALRILKQSTSIGEIPLNSHKFKAIYDLQGRRVNQPSKGLYIVDGKKVVY